MGKITSGHRISQWILASVCITTYWCIKGAVFSCYCFMWQKMIWVEGRNIFIQNIPLSSFFEAFVDANPIDIVYPQHFCHSLLDFVNLYLFESIILAFVIRLETCR